MYCSRCGTQFPDNGKFCPSCGLEVGVATTPVRAVAAGEMTDLDIVREALSAEYEIQAELGRGGMAIVYRAKDKQLEREVAVKVLPFSLSFDAEFVERFQREARTAAQLEHPNIIPIYRVGKSGRVIFFVMKFLRGKPLSKVLHDRTRLSPPEIRRLLLEAGSALGYAAKSGIVHRDIKPDNIMFDEFGTSVVADFGIAKAASGQKLTGTGMSIGTPHYMSPEQARAQPIDGRSDIYSLGIVGYQCLTGQVPYDGEDSFSIGYKHIMEPIPTPKLETADERALFEVIKRMIMKDPVDRFQDGNELIAALEGQPIASVGTARMQAAGPGARAAGAAAATTPLPKYAEGLPTPSGTRRGVATRPESTQKSGGFGVILGFILFLAAVGGGGYYFFVYKPAHAPGAPLAVIPPRDSAGVSDSTARGAGAASPSGALPAGDTAHPSRVATALPSGAVAPPAPIRDSGNLLIKGLPGGSAVYLDGHPVTTSPAKVAIGPHDLLITPPMGYQPVQNRIQIQKDQTLTLTPALSRVGQGSAGADGGAKRAAAAKGQCETPGVATYNLDGACWDTRPRAQSSLLVPFANTGASQSILWVHVTADGSVIEVRQFRPSNDDAFERAAEDYARAMKWSSATKGDEAVDGWTQVQLKPNQQ